MARVSVDGSNLVVEIEGLDRFWALKRRLVIPLAHVRAATADPGIGHRPTGIRAPGTYLPGVITAGTYRHGAVRREPALILQLWCRNSPWSGPFW